MTSVADIEESKICDVLGRRRRYNFNTRINAK